MRRLFCILSSLSLVLFIFSLTPDVHAVAGFKTELMTSHTSRTYSRSSTTTKPPTPGTSDQPEADSGSKDARPDDKKPDDDTDGGNAQSKLGAPVDDGENEDVVMLTISPLANPVSGAPAQISNLTPVENIILNSLAVSTPLAVQQQDDQGHVSLDGRLALWLSDFLHENDNPVESLNENRGMLYIPEFFGATFATYINSLPAPESSTLIFIEIVIPSGGAAPGINQQMTIHHSVSIDGQVQMNLLMNHINAITGQEVIATTIFSDDIDTTDPLKNQRKSKMVRTDSVTGADVVIGSMKGMDQDSSKKDKSSGGSMPPITEGSGNGQQDRLVIVNGFEVPNKTIAEQLIKIQYGSKIPF